jgi:alkylhydroperoxidase/carboxymuconolactone decarboxylase family protein YurZ
MADVTSEAVDQVLAEMERVRGYVYPTHRYLAEKDPGFLETWNELAGKALLHDGSGAPGEAELPVKYREIVVSAVLAFRGASTEGLVAHLRRAIDHGATKREILDAFEASAVPGGAPTFLAGVRALMELDRSE